MLCFTDLAAVRYFSKNIERKNPIVNFGVERLLILGFLSTICLIFFGCSDNDENINKSVKNSEVLVKNKPTQATIETEFPPEPITRSEQESIDFDDMEIEEVLDYANHYLKQSEWLKAKPALEYLLDDDTEPLEYHYKMGKVLFELGDYARAIDHLSYATEATQGEEDSNFRESARNYILKGRAKALELAVEMHGISESTEERADLVFQVFKLHPEIDLQKDVELPLGAEKSRRKIYYLVTAMQIFAKRLEEEKSFWSYYQWGYLNFLQKWFSDARKAVEKAILFADSHALIFYALRMQEKIEKLAPAEVSSDLDKFAVLDLNEDVLDSFLEKYQKDLSERQIHKAREVIKMGMKLKEKLERANSDQEKLKVLREFKELSEEMLSGEEFPPDIKGKIKKGTLKAEKRLLELEEQIRVKQDALRG